MGYISESLVAQCRTRLLEMKRELLNRSRVMIREFEGLDRGSNSGDEADQTMMIMAENEFLSNQRRVKEMILEVEFALARIEAGTYGLCEETEEIIETERLLALPWTRVSIEGAELREAMQKRFAR